MGPNTIPLLRHVGNCLVDSKHTSHVVSMLGPSGVGKSTLLRVLQEALHSVTANIESRTLTHDRSLDPETVTDMVGSRVIMSSDVNHEGNVGISRQAIKTITGGDAAVGTNRSSVMLSSTVLYTTNSLPSPTRVDAWCKMECVRRYACLTTCRSPGDSNIIIPPIGPEEEGVLIGAMLYTREAYDHPSGNLESLVATLIQGQYKEFMKHVLVTNPEAEDYDMRGEYQVMVALVRISGVSMPDMIGCVKAVSPRLLRMPCMDNDFRHGVIGHTIANMNKQTHREATPYEEMTRWEVYRPVSVSGEGSGTRSGSVAGGSVRSSNHGGDRSTGR